MKNRLLLFLIFLSFQLQAGPTYKLKGKVIKEDKVHIVIKTKVGIYKFLKFNKNKKQIYQLKKVDGKDLLTVESTFLVKKKMAKKT